MFVNGEEEELRRRGAESPTAFAEARERERAAERRARVVPLQGQALEAASVVVEGVGVR